MMLLDFKILNNRCFLPDLLIEFFAKLCIFAPLREMPFRDVEIPMLQGRGE